MKPTILVTPRSVTRGGHPSIEKLRAANYTVVFCTPGVQPTEEELCARLPGCVGYLAGVEPVTARVLNAASHLRVISRNGAGVDNIDLIAAARHGITVLTADGANARGVAELTIGQLFLLARRLAEADMLLKRGNWQRGGAGVELDGKILGIIGYGCIGQLVARMALGLGMRVMAHDPSCSVEQPGAGAGFRMLSFDEVIRSADFLTLHCPPPADGSSLLDATTIGRMKKGAFIVNTARRNVMDGAALLNALESGHIAGAAIDVLEKEHVDDLALSRHPRVVVTPHIGGFTVESIDRAMSAAVDNLLRALHLS